MRGLCCERPQPSAAASASTNLAGFAGAKGREVLQLRVSGGVPDVPAGTFVVHSCTAAPEGEQNQPLSLCPLSVPLLREKTEIWMDL